MKLLSNLKTSVKLIAAFVLMSIVLGFVGFYGLTNLNKSNEQLQFIVEERMIPISELGNVETLYQQIRVNIRDLVFLGETSSKKKEFEDTINAIKVEIDTKVKNYESGTIMLASEQEIIDELYPALEEYYSILEQAKIFAYSDDQEGYLRLAPAFNESGDKVEIIINELIKHNLELAQKSNEVSNAQFKQAQTNTIIVILVAMVLSIAAGYLIAKLISRPLNKVVTLLGQVANGDLSQTTNIDRKDEVGELAKSTNVMVVSLRKLMQDVMNTSQQVAASSEELTASAEQTSQATEEITNAIQGIAEGAETSTASLEESSTGLEEVTLGIQNIADSSNTIAEAGLHASAQAKMGGEFVGKTVQQIQAINQSVNESSEAIKSLDKRSQEIGEITKVITEIANQTNLLALNAAIEAARAGEHGKGFAVVADEVRKLAEQSQQSSMQISELINEIQVDMTRSNDSINQVKSDVKEGLTIVGETEESFKVILGSLDKVSMQIDDMAATAEQMSASAQEVSANVTSSASMSRESSMNSQSVAASTEEQLASMEEISSASNNLSEMAMNLQELVSKFKL
ncbi:methyl-accepting chemotaxis protein [Psychrobacillus sp. FSL K6-2836]|uniref:methyl-accepting chemotaxis protein n=1 Tax=Psychrobacillus sp. FSL K6-2836 TaxID=2921548 RepID=UPI0030F965B0